MGFLRVRDRARGTAATWLGVRVRVRVRVRDRVRDSGATVLLPPALGVLEEAALLHAALQLRVSLESVLPWRPRVTVL